MADIKWFIVVGISFCLIGLLAILFNRNKAEVDMFPVSLRFPASKLSSPDESVASQEKLIQ